MRRLQLAIADTDVDYMESVSSFVRSTHDSVKFDVKLFSKVESLHRYLSGQNSVDILMVSPELYSPQFSEASIGLILILEDDHKTNRDDDLQGLFKYQPLNQLVSKMLSIYYEHHSNFTKGGENANVISVYSASGGAGKTSLAVNLASQLTLLEKKVFYLNLETINSTSLFFTSHDDKPSSQIFYYTKTRPEQLVSKIESLKKYHPSTKVEYFDLAVNVEEMLSLTESEVAALISGLMETHHYDYIIIDLDSSVHDRVKAAFKISDQILWVLNNDLHSFYKTEYMLKKADDIFGNDAGVMEKAIVVLNQYNGSLDGGMNFNIDISGYLPEIPHWKGIRNGRDVLATPVFTKELLSILGIIEKEEQGGHVWSMTQP